MPRLPAVVGAGVALTLCMGMVAVLGDEPGGAAPAGETATTSATAPARSLTPTKPASNTPTTSSTAGHTADFTAIPPANAPRVAAPASRPAPAYNPRDPATWSPHSLAAQLTFTCRQASDTAGMRADAAAGVGGIAIVGRHAPADLGARLASVRAVAPHGVLPFVAADEEGGQVQRLRDVIYPLPSAQAMGSWPGRQLRGVAMGYGRRMHALGVTMSFAPVADLTVPGSFTATEHRGFSGDPRIVAADITAWAAGLRAAGEIPVVKHWPGHGHAGDSHAGPAHTPPLSYLARHDMVPFTDYLHHSAEAVMVGHLDVPGLTEPGTPASESPHALAELRREAGPATLILADSLSMGAASGALGLTIGQAAVRAVRAGADIALACESPGVVAALDTAIRRGQIPRAQAVASARRILALKKRAHLLPGT